MKGKEIGKFENEVNIIPYGKEEIDYLNFVTRTSTEAQRRKFDIGDILINAAVCKKCNTYIRSINRHDYKMCDCQKVGVDGGSWYAKRMGNDKDRVDIIELFYGVRKNKSLKE